MDEKKLAELENRARRIRYDIVRMVGPGVPGHFGGSCSAADIVAALYFHKLRIDPKNPLWPERDRFIMSKGHSALAQYAALAESGYFPMEELITLKKLGSRLQGHPDFRKTPGIDAGTGSLGQGLSIGLGLVLGLKLSGYDSKVYVMMGDGELNEGQVWEAAMAASHYKTDNLITIVDANGLQAMGPVRESMDTGNLRLKFEAFGFTVQEVDGHDMAQIVGTLDAFDDVKGHPKLLLAHTVKGRGIPCAENVVSFHNGTLTQEQYEAALAALEG